MKVQRKMCIQEITEGLLPIAGMIADPPEGCDFPRFLAVCEHVRAAREASAEVMDFGSLTT
jgi:hypothetical protein